MISNNIEDLKMINGPQIIIDHNWIGFYISEQMRIARFRDLIMAIQVLAKYFERDPVFMSSIIENSIKILLQELRIGDKYQYDYYRRKDK
jgi:hypothetical protein